MNTQKTSSQSAPGQAQDLLQKYTADSSFKAEFDAASTRETAVQVAARHGMAVGTQDLAALGESSQELSDATLDRVCGGVKEKTVNITIY